MDGIKNAAPGNNPWEDRTSVGFFNGLWETIKRVLLKPGEFFSLLVIKDSIKDPYLFYFILTYVTGIISVIVSIIIKPVDNLLYTLIFASIFMLLIASFALFIAAAVLHLGVMVFGGTGGYKGTLNVIAYASASSVFSFIPFIGGMVSGIWGIVIGIKGFKRVHNLSTPKAILAYFGIFFIIAVISLMAAIAIPNLLRARVDANYAAAKANINAISTALETYAVANAGKYPAAEYDLVYKQPTYLSQTFDEKEIGGYRYFVDLGADTYKLVAEPITCNVTGNKIIILEKGTVIQEKNCK